MNDSGVIFYLAVFVKVGTLLVHNIDPSKDIYVLSLFSFLDGFCLSVLFTV